MNSPALEFKFHGDAIRGERPNQEDCWEVQHLNGASPARDPGAVLAILSDGMGGHASGEVASELACATFLQSFTSQNGAIGERLEQSLDATNAALGRAVRENADLNGMGCTLVACFVDQKGLRFASVGDSVLLLFRNRQIKQINQDHSIGALLDKQAEARIISRAEAENNPRRHTLRSALTGAEIPLRDVCGKPIALLPGDWLLIASDGIATLSQKEIAAVMATVSDASPQAAVAALLQAVVSKRTDNQDNTSIIALRVVDATDAATRIVRPRDENQDKTEIIDRGAPRTGNGKAAARALVAALVVAIALIGFWFASWRSPDVPEEGAAMSPQPEHPRNKLRPKAAKASPENRPIGERPLQPPPSAAPDAGREGASERPQRPMSQPSPSGEPDHSAASERGHILSLPSSPTPGSDRSGTEWPPPTVRPSPGVPVAPEKGNAAPAGRPAPSHPPNSASSNPMITPPTKD